MSVTHCIGRRKTSVARVYLIAGSGEIKVNARDFKEYFPTGPLQYILTQAQQAVHELRQKRQQMVIAAQNELQQLQQRELSDIRRYTEDEARKKAGERVVGGRGASSQSSAPRAKVAPDFVDEVMNKLGVDRETAIRRIQGSGIQIQ